MARNEFFPIYVGNIGLLIDERISELGLSQGDVAKRAGLSQKTMSQLVNGHIRLTPPMAAKLENVLGIESEYLLRIQAEYDASAERAKKRKELSTEVAWVKVCPYSELVNRGIILGASSSVDRLLQLLRFYECDTPSACMNSWQAKPSMLRAARAWDSEAAHLAAWLKVGELAARELACQSYDKVAFRQALVEARTLSLKEDPIIALQAIQDEFASAGVALAFVKQFKGTRCSGASQWLTPDKALILLSFRYKTDDQLWFTLFHEAGHLLNDSKKETYLENSDASCDSIDESERQADKFASDFLIEPLDYERLIGIERYTRSKIVEESRKIGVAPGIIVGRLQHDSVLPWQTGLNRFKRKLGWDDPRAEALGYVVSV